MKTRLINISQKSVHTLFVFALTFLGNFFSAPKSPLRPGLHATPTPFFFKFSLFWETGIMLLLRLNQGISSGCYHATPTPTIFNFLQFSLFWGCGHYASFST